MHRTKMTSPAIHVELCKARKIAIVLGCLSLIGTTHFLFSQEKTDTPLLSSVRVVGNKALSSDVLLQTLGLHAHTAFANDTLRAALGRLYKQYEELGYPFIRVRVDSTRDSLGVSLQLLIQEGTQALLDAVAIAGAVALPEKIKEEIQTSTADIACTPQAIQNVATKVLEYYRGHGYPFASVDVARVEYVADSTVVRAKIFLKVAEGERVRIQKVRINGNEGTQADLILRAARIRLGDFYDETEMEKVRQRLLRLGIFSEVHKPELYVSGHESGVLINVKEGLANTFNGFIGYIPSAATVQRGYFIGDATIVLRNLFGTGRAFSAQWKKEDQLTQALRVSYREPFIFHLPVNVEVGYGLRQQDSTYVLTELQLSSDAELWDGLFVGATFAERFVTPSASIGILGYGTLTRSSRRSTSLFLRYDSRDNVWAPVSGFRYETEYAYGLKSHATVMQPVQEMRVDGEGYWSFLPRSVLALRLHLRDIRGSSIDVSDLYRIGGSKLLRGYREGQFLASRAIIGTVEYRFLTGKSTFLFVFLDAGSLQQLGGSSEGFALQARRAEKLGYGLGIQMETPLGLINVGYALGAGDTFTTGKMHLSIVNEF
ncbi:MAG: BamA/OMP85 family outer membrane protein [Bacteroidota bacterium]